MPKTGYRQIARRQFLRGSLAGLGISALTIPGRADTAPTPQSTPDNPIVVLPKLNQIGFAPQGRKRFTISEIPGHPVTRFAIETTEGWTLYRDRLEPRLYNMSETTGEHVRCGDFTPLTRPGRYCVVANGKRSYPFTITATPYGDLLHDAARAFYLIRANAPLSDPLTGIRHHASHQMDHRLMVGGIRRDLSGGWYNAGDYGKWTNMAAISASHMMWLYELRPDTVSMLDLDIPNPYPGLPDLLAEARWGLEWLHRMQNPDGSVLHKVDTEPDFAWGWMPENDPYYRHASGIGSLNAGVFVAVMAQAARVYAPFDEAFARSCAHAAQISWHWLADFPNLPTRDPYYTDRDATQEKLWALCEMARLTDDDDRLESATDKLEKRGVDSVSWTAPHILGALSLSQISTSRSADIARAAIFATAGAISARIAGDAYGFSTVRTDYDWGSAANALNDANTCLLAAELTGVPECRAAGVKLLDYILGNNSLGLCMLTGHGTHNIRRPYHWTFRTQGQILPGWVSGGPNVMLSGGDSLLETVIGRGVPPAKCLVDACTDDGSWASNEGETSENAALVLALGLYDL